MTEIVYRGHDNKASITVSMDGEPMDFSAVTRMTLELQGQGVVADSDVDAGLIDWSAGDGLVEFDLGAIDLARGSYEAILVAYDNAHQAGQVIAHPSGERLSFKFVD
jgi:hypothetical protein